jgi:hypothetical protein
MSVSILKHLTFSIYLISLLVQQAANPSSKYKLSTKA